MKTIYLQFGNYHRCAECNQSLRYKEVFRIELTKVEFNLCEVCTRKLVKDLLVSLSLEKR